MYQARIKDFKLSSYAINAWVVIAPHGTTKDDVLKYEFWAHVFGKLQRHDMITIISDDESFEMDVRVTSVGAFGPGAEVRVIRMWSRGDKTITSDTPSVNEFELSFTPSTQWRIVNKESKTVLKSGFPSKEEAQAHIEAITRSAKSSNTKG